MTHSTDVPFQVISLIDNLNNKKEPDHVRLAYKKRLLSIKETVDDALTKFDLEI